MQILLQPNDISRITGFGGNIDIDSIKPAIVTAQMTHLKRIVGKQLFEKLLLGDLTGDYLELYDEYIVYILSWYSASIYLSLSTIKTANNGSFKLNGNQNDTLPTQNELVILSKNYENIAISYESILKEWFLTKSIPEYTNVNPTTNKIVKWY